MDSESLRAFVLKKTYLVVDDQGLPYIFSSLREIAKNLEINHTTISKKLSISSSGDIFSSRKTNRLYYIRRVCNSQ